MTTKQKYNLLKERYEQAKKEFEEYGPFDINDEYKSKFYGDVTQLHVYIRDTDVLTGRFDLGEDGKYHTMYIAKYHDTDKLLKKINDWYKDNEDKS